MPHTIEPEHAMIRWDTNGKVGIHIVKRVVVRDDDDGALIHASVMGPETISAADLVGVLDGKHADTLGQLAALRVEHGALAQEHHDAKASHMQAATQYRKQLRDAPMSAIGYVLGLLDPDTAAKVQGAIQLDQQRRAAQGAKTDTGASK